MATYTLSNTAGEIDTGIARAYARIGSTGNNATNFGFGNTASTNESVAVGYGNVASGQQSVSVGVNNSASAYLSFAFGFGNYATQQGSFAAGLTCSADSLDATALGTQVTVSSPRVQELGYWSDFSTRGGSLRIHGQSGYAVMSVPIGNTGYGDGGTTHGAELDGTIFRNGLSFKVNTAKDKLWVFYNDSAGTIRSGQVALS